MQLPAQYTEARRALAKCVKITQAKQIYSKAMGMEEYAYQAKDRDLVAWSAEVRKRAEREIGRLIAEARKAGKLAKNAPGPGRGKKARPAGDPAFPTLADQGVDKHLADRARQN